MKKKHTLSLDEDIVEKAKEKLEEVGGKLSPFVNIQLKKFIEEDGRRKK